jgi:ribose-phosphate pyrophosphokinase
VDNLYASPVLLQQFRHLRGDIVMVSPDAGGVERARLTVSDRGALECVIRARVETAVLRGRGES